MELWAKKRKQRLVLRYLKQRVDYQVKKNKMKKYCDEFYMQGLRRRVLKGIKLFSGMAGHKIYEKKLKGKYELEVEGKINEQKNQVKFLEDLIFEMEEKYKIELRKKAILKNQCDQAYLRGVSSMSMEALKMSNSTLSDYYAGMKMPNYDGKNIFTQIRSLNGASTGFQEIIDGPVLTQQELYVQQQKNLIN